MNVVGHQRGEHVDGVAGQPVPDQPDHPRGYMETRYQSTILQPGNRHLVSSQALVAGAYAETKGGGVQKN